MDITENIIKRFKNADEEAFEIIFNEFYKLVYYVIFQNVKNRESSEELMIDTFTKAFYKAETLKSHSKSNLKYWLIKIARNVSLDYIKSQKNNSIIYDEQIVLLASDNKQNMNDLKDIIYKNINNEEKDIINYYIVCGFKFREIATMMNSTTSIIAKKYKKAIHQIKKYLDEGR